MIVILHFIVSIISLPDAVEGVRIERLLLLGGGKLEVLLRIDVAAAPREELPEDVHEDADAPHALHRVANLEHAAELIEHVVEHPQLHLVDALT